MLELLRELVARRSLSGAEDAAAAVVADFARQAGFAPQRHGNNVYFEFGSGAPRLLLNSHLDTVPPSGGWDSDPWTPVVRDGKLTGLGANDAKGCVTAILHACRRLQREGLGAPGTVVAALSAEEENGGPDGMTALLPRLGPLDAAIVGEPTGLAPCTAQSGILLLNCVAQGQAGHVAHAGVQHTVNAIHVAAADIAALAALRFTPYPGAPAPTQPQVTLISGGLTANQVPERCEFLIDLRTTPNLDHAQLTAQLRALLASEVRCRSGRYQPVATPPGSAIARACLRASGKPPYYSGTCSDWALLDGLPAVKAGPGDSARSHQPNEYLREDELAAGVEFYCAAVRAYFEEVRHGA